MPVWEAILCGLVQGITEFLPVSSSGHLAICHALFPMGENADNLTFDLLLHLATLFVVFVFFRKEIFSLLPAVFTGFAKMIKGNFHMASYTAKERYVLFLILATAPLALAFFIKDSVEIIGTYPKAVGILLVGNGILLLLADRAAKKKKAKEMNGKLAFGVGLFQLLAVVPGLSRSGSTIAGGLFGGLDREEALRFSFLLSIPAILGANLANLPAALATPLPRSELYLYLIGMTAAIISGFAAMQFLTYMAKKRKFGFFAYYTIATGLLTVIFL